MTEVKFMMKKVLLLSKYEKLLIVTDPIKWLNLLILSSSRSWTTHLFVQSSSKLVLNKCSRVYIMQNVCPSIRHVHSAVVVNIWKTFFIQKVRHKLTWTWNRLYLVFWVSFKRQVRDRVIRRPVRLAPPHKWIIRWHSPIEPGLGVVKKLNEIKRRINKR